MDWLKEVKKAAEEVLGVLGGGYDEGTYEEALAHELRIRKIPYERQRNLEILYKGYGVGWGIPDLIINPRWLGRGGEELVLELKAVKKIGEDHKRQAQVYMASLDIDRGAVLNFGETVTTESVSKPKNPPDATVVKPARKFSGDLAAALKKSARAIYQYFGKEFIYAANSLKLFSAALGVDLRLQGIDFAQGAYDILYKRHKVNSYDFDFVFANGEVAEMMFYEEKEEIFEGEEELKSLVRNFNLKRGYLIAIPEGEEGKVLVKTV